MSLLELGAIGVLEFLIHQSRKAESQKSEEEHKRRTTPYYFDEGITEEDFRNIVLQASRHIKRVEKLTSDGLIVSGSFRSQSGLTSCDFEIDFNDYGHITGKYCCWGQALFFAMPYPEELAALQRDYAALWGPLSDLLKQLSALVEL